VSFGEQSHQQAVDQIPLTHKNLVDFVSHAVDDMMFFFDFFFQIFDDHSSSFFRVFCG